MGKLGAKRITGIIGAVLVLLGSIMPIATMPLVGGLTLFARSGDGIILVALTAVGLALFCMKWPRLGSTAGLLVLIFVLLELMITSSVIDKFRTDAAKRAQGINAITAVAVLNGTGLSFGWFFLIPGALMMTVAGFVPEKRQPASSGEITLTAPPEPKL